ncbi:hypothetical protein GBAR_LOCUS23079 [Geodia barretti]|uniref:Uncharacterized protein n=1 Tax=Geodia barretti TaxID=519541 RepID=A0AA35T4X9_GEOBA|nr:hypothetical protein GBAR_LOCUS23079 [Geodia barretti]
MVDQDLTSLSSQPHAGTPPFLHPTLFLCQPLHNGWRSHLPVLGINGGWRRERCGSSLTPPPESLLSRRNISCYHFQEVRGRVGTDAMKPVSLSRAAVFVTPERNLVDGGGVYGDDIIGGVGAGITASASETRGATE